MRCLDASTGLRLAHLALVASVALGGCTPDETKVPEPMKGTDAALETTDTRFDSGEFYDQYAIEAVAGELLVADVRTDDYDPYLVVVSPTGRTIANDDWLGSSSWSRIETVAVETGTWTVKVTSYESEAVGSYHLELRTEPVEPTPGRRFEHGTLAEGDATFDSGEYVDSVTLEGSAGEYLLSICGRPISIPTWSSGHRPVILSGTTTTKAARAAHWSGWSSPKKASTSSRSPATRPARAAAGISGSNGCRHPRKRAPGKRRAH